MKSVAGIIECYLISRGQLSNFVNGGRANMDTSKYMVPIGIAGNKQMKMEDFNPLKDSYQNVLRNKKNFVFQPESFITDWATLQTLQYFAVIDSGCDAVLVSENFQQYEGGIDGTPKSGPSDSVNVGYFWRNNPNEGIFYFTQDNLGDQPAQNTYFGIGFEYILDTKSCSVKLNLEVAMGMYNALQTLLAAKTNILFGSHTSNAVPPVTTQILLPQYEQDKQIVFECTGIQYSPDGGTTWVDIFDWADISSRKLSIKTVDNKRESDNRQNIQLCEVDLEIVGDDASCQKINDLWSLDQFAAIRLMEQHPNGDQYTVEIQKNTITNTTAPLIDIGKRNNTFAIKGQCPIRRWNIDVENKGMSLGLI